MCLGKHCIFLAKFRLLCNIAKTVMSEGYSLLLPPMWVASLLIVSSCLSQTSVIFHSSWWKLFQRHKSYNFNSCSVNTNCIWQITKLPTFHASFLKCLYISLWRIRHCRRNLHMRVSATLQTKSLALQNVTYKHIQLGKHLVTYSNFLVLFGGKGYWLQNGYQTPNYFPKQSN